MRFPPRPTLSRPRMASALKDNTTSSPSAVRNAGSTTIQSTSEGKAVTERGSHCLSILDQAKVDQDEALALYEQARQPGVGNASELVRQANQKSDLRREAAHPHRLCESSQSSADAPRADRAERGSAKLAAATGQEDPSEKSQDHDPTSEESAATNRPGPRRIDSLTHTDSADSIRTIEPEATAGRGHRPQSWLLPIRHSSPPFTFADGLSKGMDDCFAGICQVIWLRLRWPCSRGWNGSRRPSRSSGKPDRSMRSMKISKPMIPPPIRTKPVSGWAN